MNQISVAIALQGGEIASAAIDLIDGHPLLDFCGAARSMPDLVRLLERFRPQVLLISPSILEDLMVNPPQGEALKILSDPLSFLFYGLDLKWRAEDLARAWRQPLRYCGIINITDVDSEELFRLIKEKVSLYSCGSRESRAVDGANRASRFLVMTGCKGGVGNTLLSCALSAALVSSQRRVLLMDMDADLSQLLHIKNGAEGKSLTDLLPMAEDISWDLIRVSINKHPSGFYLLPYGLRPYEGVDIEEALRVPFLRNMLFLFDVVIMDYPRSLGRDFRTLLHHEPTVILVSLPDTLSANCAKRKVAFIRRSGIEQAQLRLILNRCGSHHALGPDEIARATGLDLLACVPEDDRSGLDFAELGQIPRPDSNLGRAANLAAASLGFEITLEGKAGGRKGLRMWRGRSQEAAIEGWGA
jgi:MinD-like ATPase involved in chromosome partitioning or flagellar assembly